MSAILMVPLLAISGMATDLGGWYAEGAKMQKAADAAALAGVVWLPNLSQATAVAKDTAKANGFDDADADIVVTVAQTTNSELKVTITDSTAPLFFSKFFLSNVSITREAFAEYVLAVPLGSPRNYFGTGNLAAAPDGFWAAINGYCAPKEQGDPFSSGYQGNWPSGGQTCPGGSANPDHIATPDYAYDYIVELPASRAQPVQLHIYNAAYTGASPDTSCCGSMTTEFVLRSPDSTPFNDADNPVTSCTGAGESNPRTYASGTTDNDATIFGATDWSKYCTIPTSSPGGQYIVSVRSLQGELGSSVVNSYSIMASYNGNGVACDGRTDATCPRVFGKEWVSIYAQSGAASAEFFLSEIGTEHAGKQMQITLFDPGEGGNDIEILDPNGNPTNFSYQTQDGLYSGTSTNQLDVSGCSGWPQVGADRSSQCRYNERFVTLIVDIPATYATLYPGQKWWKIRYNFSASVTDRSTWSVRVLGDPVHLSH